MGATIKKWIDALEPTASKDTHINIITGFLINMQVQEHNPHQWAPFQVTA